MDEKVADLALTVEEKTTRELDIMKASFETAMNTARKSTLAQLSPDTQLQVEFLMSDTREKLNQVVREAQLYGRSVLTNERATNLEAMLKDKATRKIETLESAFNEALDKAREKVIAETSADIQARIDRIVTDSRTKFIQGNSDSDKSEHDTNLNYIEMKATELAASIELKITRQLKGICSDMQAKTLEQVALASQ